MTATMLHRAPRLGRAAALLALLIAGGAGLAAQDNPQRAIRTYNIPAQPLGTALSRFAEESGVDVLLDEPTATGRRSSPLIGTYATPQALNVLLGGTGLVARFTSARSAVIIPGGQLSATAATPMRPSGRDARPVLTLDLMRVTAPRLIGGPPQHGGEMFALTLAGMIRRLVADARIMDGGAAADLRLRTRIRRDGTLYDVHLISGSRDVRLNERILGLLEGARVAASPPEGLRQPLIFDVRGR